MATFTTRLDLELLPASYRRAINSFVLACVADSRILLALLFGEILFDRDETSDGIGGVDLLAVTQPAGSALELIDQMGCAHSTGGSDNTLGFQRERVRLGVDGEIRVATAAAPQLDRLLTLPHVPLIDRCGTYAAALNQRAAAEVCRT